MLGCYLVSRERANSLHHCQSGKMLHEGNPSPQCRVEINLDGESEHGAAKRTEPRISPSTWSSHRYREGLY